LLPERSGGIVPRKIEILGIALAIFLSTVVIILSPTIVPVIFPSFISSITLMQVMSLAVIPATIVSIRKAKLFSEEKPLSILLSNVASVTSVILGVIFLPMWIGNLGLAIAIVVSQMVMAAFLEIACRLQKSRDSLVDEYS